MPSPDRCPRCDRAECSTYAVDHSQECNDNWDGPIGSPRGCPGCVAQDDCDLHAVDWRARAIALRAGMEAALKRSEGSLSTLYSQSTGCTRNDLTVIIGYLRTALATADGAK